MVSEASSNRESCRAGRLFRSVGVVDVDTHAVARRALSRRWSLDDLDPVVAPMFDGALDRAIPAKTHRWDIDPCRNESG